MITVGDLFETFIKNPLTSKKLVKQVEYVKLRASLLQIFTANLNFNICARNWREYLKDELRHYQFLSSTPSRTNEFPYIQNPDEERVDICCSLICAAVWIVYCIRCMVWNNIMHHHLHVIWFFSRKGDISIWIFYFVLNEVKVLGISIFLSLFIAISSKI